MKLFHTRQSKKYQYAHPLLFQWDIKDIGQRAKQKVSKYSLVILLVGFCSLFA